MSSFVSLLGHSKRYDVVGFPGTAYLPQSQHTTSNHPTNFIMRLTLPITLACSILPGLAWAQINENDYYVSNTNTQHHIFSNTSNPRNIVTVTKRKIQYACDTRDRTPGEGAIWDNGQCARRRKSDDLRMASIPCNPVSNRLTDNSSLYTSVVLDYSYNF